MMFIRKVYSILAIQLTFTAACIVAVQTSDQVKVFMMDNSAIYIAAAVMSIVFMCAILCCFARVHPTNMILLVLFTVCEAYMVAGITAQYE